MAKGPRGEKRPADVIGAAIKVAKIATGEIRDERMAKPGRVRSGKAGGKARAKSLSPEERTQIAMTAADARWSKDMNEKLAEEIEANLAAFNAKLHDLLAEHRNRYALLRKKEIVGIFDTIRDAKTTGDKLYPDGIFSIQKVTDKPVELGVFSHAVHLGDAQ